MAPYSLAPRRTSPESCTAPSLTPLTLLSGWVKGCPCHDEELNMGKQSQCPWKGRRGSTFAG
eukprot:9359209-Lingulodinium_polyedra.AAC.1